MGVNLMTACHKHKVKVFHFRDEEQYTLIPFYYKHRDCLEADPTISVETLEDQEQERNWMADYPDGYATDTEIQFKHPHFDDPENRKWYEPAPPKQEVDK